MAFNFDLNKLMQDPNFVSGVGLLGAASSRNAPLLTAFKMLQQQEQTKQEQARHQQNADLQRQNFGLQQQRLGLEQEEQGYMRDYRSAQAATSRVNAERYGQDIDLRGKEFQRKQQMDRFMMQVLPSLMQGGQLPPGMMPQGAEQPLEEPVGKYGTPKRILMNLKQIESGGNPLAMGPDIGGGVRAQGAFQFLPDTVKMLQAQGIKFDPFKPQEAEDAADFYIQSLVKKHGGDYSKALADYGGFKSKDPTQYVTKVLAGSPEQNARQHLQLQNVQATQQRYAPLNPTMNPGFSYKDGEFSMDFKPSYEPHKIQIDREKLEVDRAEAARRGRESAADYGPGGFKERNVRVQETEADIKAAAEGRHQTDARRAAEQKAFERNEAKAKDWKAFAAVNANTDLLGDKINKLVDHPGLERIFGFQGSLPDYPGSDAANARTLHSSVIAQNAKETLNAMRDASKTGGALGNVSDADVKLLERAIQSLESAQSPKAARDAMREVQRHSNRLREIAISAYEKTYGESPVDPDLPVGSRLSDKKTKAGKPLYRAPNGKLYEVN